MSLVSFLALALFVAIASLVILDGRETSRDHQQVMIATNEPVSSSLKPRSSLRNRQWCSARIARLRQVLLRGCFVVKAASLGVAALSKGFDYFAARSVAVGGF